MHENYHFNLFVQAIFPRTFELYVLVNRSKFNNPSDIFQISTFFYSLRPYTYFVPLKYNIGELFNVNNKCF